MKSDGQPASISSSPLRGAAFSDEDNGTEFKPWRCGEPFVYPPPSLDEDPWSILLKPLAEKDKARCEAWKEEVQNLLIFAGLFSAVVTAFIVESYQNLKPDSTDTSAVLLAAILSHLKNTTGSVSVQTLGSTGIPQFSPTPSNVRINLLWFLSLVFSLTTVLVGIVALQWIREHQRPREDITSQLPFSMFNMRVEALERWYVPQIFTLLPLLLQGGLILFLVGIIDFLWQLNRTIAIPVLISISLTLIFLSMTTLLPTLQSLALFGPRIRITSNITPRVPCPYQFPQSWAFHQLIAPIPYLAIKLFSSDPFRSGAELLPETIMLPDRPPGRLPHTPHVIFRWKKGDSWLQHGVAWLYQRDIDRMAAQVHLRWLPKTMFSQMPLPIYDAMAVLSAMQSVASRREHESVAVDLCFRQLLFSDKGPRNNQSLAYVSYLRGFFGSGTTFTGPESVRVREMVQVDTLFRFHTHNACNVHSSVDQRRRTAEIAIRLIERMYGHDPRPSAQILDTGPYYISPIEWLRREAHTLSASNDRDAFLPILRNQVLHIIRRFFTTTADLYLNEQDLGATTHTSSETFYFLTFAGDLVRRASFSEDVVSQEDSIFSFIKDRLQAFLDATASPSPPSQGPDLLFYTASIYILSIIRRSEGRISHSLRELLVVIDEYKVRVGRRLDLEDCLGVSWSPVGIFWLMFYRYASQHGLNSRHTPSIHLAQHGPFNHDERDATGDALVEMIPSNLSPKVAGLEDVNNS